MNTYTRPDNGANAGTNAGIYFINRNEVRTAVTNWSTVAAGFSQLRAG